MPTLQATMKLTVFPAVLNNLLNEKSGPTGHLCQEAASAVLAASRDEIGTAYSGHHPERGSLKDSGRIEPSSTDPAGPSWQVVFDHPIATIHHEGASPHSIGNAGQILARRGPGGYTFGPRRGPVSHRGHTGNPYLINGARAVGLRLSGALKQGQSIPFPIARI